MGSSITTGPPVAGSILIAHLLRSRENSISAKLPVSLDGQDTRFSPWRPGFDSRTGNANALPIGTSRRSRVRFPPRHARLDSVTTTILSNLNGSLDKWEQFHRRGPSEKIFFSSARYRIAPNRIRSWCNTIWIGFGAEEKKSAKDRFGIKNFLRSDLLTG